jgi:hypothetical protein
VGLAVRSREESERSTNVTARMRAILAVWVSQRPELRSRHGGWSVICGMVLAVAPTSAAAADARGGARRLVVGSFARKSVG